MPYLEQEALFRQIQADFNPRNVSAAKWFWSAPATGPGPPHAANCTAAMRQLPMFRCPSAPDYIPPANDSTPQGGGTLLGLHVYNRANSGREVHTVGWRDEYGGAASFRPLGRTNYMGVAGCGLGTSADLARYEGVYTNRTQHALGAGIPDGTSNTLLYGETSGSKWVSRPRSRDISWMAGGGLGTYLGLRPGHDAPVISFSSHHPAGVLFCFADGSVRALCFGNTRWRGRKKDPVSADWRVLQQMAGRADGAAAESSLLAY